MFIRDCVQSFMMDGKEVVILVYVLEHGIHVYTVPVEVADELNLDEYEDKDLPWDDELMERLKEYLVSKERGKKLPFVKINELW